jgi:hypothetical protein
MVILSAVEFCQPIWDRWPFITRDAYYEVPWPSKNAAEAVTSLELDRIAQEGLATLTTLAAFRSRRCFINLDIDPSEAHPDDAIQWKVSIILVRHKRQTLTRVFSLVKKNIFFLAQGAFQSLRFALLVHLLE